MTRLVAGIFMISLAIGGGLSLLASKAPDGLEHSMEQIRTAKGEPAIDSPMPDYEAPCLESPLARKAVAGLAGILAVLGLVLLVGWNLRRAGR